jgi:hypothetical protein
VSDLPATIPQNALCMPAVTARRLAPVAKMLHAGGNATQDRGIS